MNNCRHGDMKANRRDDMCNHCAAYIGQYFDNGFIRLQIVPVQPV